MDLSWERWSEDLAARMVGLPEGGFVNTSGPAVTVGGGRGLLGRRTPQRAAPYVNVLHLEGHLLVESVAAFPTAYEWPVTDEVRAGLQQLGWSVPGDSGYAGDGGFQRYAPFGDVTATARLIVAAYQALGVGSPDEVAVEVGG